MPPLELSCSVMIFWDGGEFGGEAARLMSVKGVDLSMVEEVRC